VYYNRVVAVIDSGYRECVQLTDSDGCKIVCTPDHPFLTADGTYIPARLLIREHATFIKVGSMKPHEGQGRTQYRHIKTEFTKHHPHGYRKEREGKYFYREVPRARLVVEAALNDLPYNKFVSILKHDQQAAEELQYLNPKLEVHHINEDATNDVISNLQVLSKKAHARLHGKIENFHVEYTKTARIRTMKHIGVQPTYDIQMEDPDRNFAANGFLVHNSGKTRAVMARIARMVKDGLDPKWILAMTFTNAAKDEMNNRLERLGVKGGRVGTIHSVAREILSTDEMLPDLRLIGSGVAKIFLRDVLTSMRKKGSIPRQRKNIDVEGIQKYIECCKATGPCHVNRNPFGLNAAAEEHHLHTGRYYEEESRLGAEILYAIYIELEDTRFHRAVYDFDDMQLWAWMQLLADPYGTRIRWRNRYAVVIVDEAQDSNKVQWDMARFLTGLEPITRMGQTLDCAPKRDDGEHNLMVLGDSSQSIYAFRQATPMEFVNFSYDKDVKLIELTRNYRSTPGICEISHRLVKDNSWHLASTITPAAGGEIDLENPGIVVQEYAGALEEAVDIVTKCREHEGGLKQSAVLCRLSVFLNLVEIECIRNRIPYEKRAGGSFFASNEVMDLMAYLRAATGYDPEGKHLRRAIRRPYRFIGKPTLERAFNRHDPKDPLRTLDFIRRDFKLSHKQVEDMEKLCSVFRQLKAQLTLEPQPGAAASLLALVLRETDYFEATRADADVMAPDESRQEIVSELQRIAIPFKSTVEFITYVDQLAAAIKVGQKQLQVKDPNRQDHLVLSTIHRAKGLEWSNVYLTDVNQGRFPCSRSNDYAEELRLLFVAITRAKHLCHISFQEPKSGEVESAFTLSLKSILEGLRKEAADQITDTSND